MISNIIFLIGGKNLFSLEIFAFYLIKQVGIAALLDIVQNGVRSNGALFTL